ncbi:hypothetical protein AVEN_256113-1 [Araneus ventricosus]|uniref:Uncharacterized protein n=1 Tax=Araneus ventricosus TaxID=182803 RepID=A0A4Y2D5R8_ARAVE|nr:hypothetical protein AVEN_256113-1 [Araneus ventricosus]
MIATNAVRSVSSPCWSSIEQVSDFIENERQPEVNNISLTIRSLYLLCDGLLVIYKDVKTANLAYIKNAIFGYAWIQTTIVIEAPSLSVDK